MDTNQIRKSFEKLVVGKEYSRRSLDEVFEIDTFSKSREGLVFLKGFTFLMVTLEKTNKPQNLQYNDYFEEDFFHWDSQTTQHINTPKIQEMVSGFVDTLLFARELDKIKNKTQPFIYCGRIEYSQHDPSTTKPVHLIFESKDFIENTTGGIKSIYDWSPSKKGFGTTSKINTRNKTSKRRARSQGFEVNPLKKKAVELHAMGRAGEHYKDLGYDVEDTSSNHPYDLVCTKPNGECRRIEVKGTRGLGEDVIVTKNEVESARDSAQLTDLFIVHSIDIREEDGKYIASGGEMNLIEDWVPLKADLTPLSYRYRVSNKQSTPEENHKDEYGFEKIPSLFEKMKSTWGKIIFQNSKTVEVDEPDLQVIRRAFIAAANYEDMNERWHEASRLFIDKNQWPKEDHDAIYIKAVKEAVDIMQIVQDHKGKKFHPLKNKEMQGYFMRQYLFSHQEEDGSYCDDKGNSYASEGDLRKQIVRDIADKYGFPTPKAASEHLRKYCGLKNLPDFRDHSKDLD